MTPRRDRRTGGFGPAYAELRRRQKTSAGVSLYSRWVNRPGGRVLTAVLAQTRATPNQVSVLSCLVSGAGIAMIALWPGASWAGPVIWAALALGFMLDSADGQLARLTGTGGPAGEWLDHVLDVTKHVAVHSGVLVAWYRSDELPADWIAVPLVFQLVAVVMFAGGTLADLLLRDRPSGTGARPSTLRALLLLPADYGIFCLVFLLVGWPSLFAAAYTALAGANLVLLVALLSRWFRRLRGTDTPAAARAMTSA